MISVFPDRVNAEARTSFRSNADIFAPALFDGIAGCIVLFSPKS
jgi:hypothetical protein